MKAKPMVMAFISGKMVIDSKVNGIIALSMDRDQIFSRMEMFSQALIFRANQKE